MLEQRHIKVLVIEDDEFISMVYADLLQGVSNTNFDLSVFGTLNQGIKALQNGHYDVLLLDLNLPDSDFTHTIAQLPTLSAKLPVVIMTSTVDDVLALKTMNLGGQDYLTKSKLDRTLFIRSILYAIERHQLRKQLHIEKEKSEKLLRNILPQAIADELKIAGTIKARSYDEASVMFVDFGDFTSISSKMNHETLVDELHSCFTLFDEVIEKSGLEKIKTIGDAYMCAGGIPDPDAKHLEKMVAAAFDILRITEKRYQEKIKQGKEYWRARIGIHIGPIVAGVVGSKKFQYDIWGDTVNTAARIESSGVSGRINVSEAVYLSVKHLPGIAFEHRGKIEAKGKGEIDMFFLLPNEQ